MLSIDIINKHWTHSHNFVNVIIFKEIKEKSVSNLFLTLLIAFIVIVLALASLAIGWLITGRARIERSCGKDPTKKKDENCGDSTSCDLCDSPKKKSCNFYDQDSKQLDGEDDELHKS